MPVESSSGFVNNLDPLSPDGSEGVNEGDNHLRALKQILKNTFPNFTGAMTATNLDLSNPKGNVSGQLWTGSHNFSGSLSAATPPTDVIGPEVVTAAWVIAKLTSGTAENFGGLLKASSDINGGM
jgi:hypothetical protein